MCLNQIENLFLMDPQGTEVGLMLCNLAGGFDQSADTLQVLKDCFAKKAPATILERTSALWTRAGWMLENEQTTIWDVNERQSYSYMCCLRNNQAAPTKASQLVEAWSPLDSTLGLEKTFCKNVPSPGVQRAAPCNVLPQLTVSAVKALEFICTSNTSPPRSAISGALWLCISDAARWSDFTRLEGIGTGGCGELVLVETEASRHKTSKSNEAKTRLLPTTALEGSCWMILAENVFVSALNLTKSHTRLTFMSSWNDRSGTWPVSPITTAEESPF